MRRQILRASPAALRRAMAMFAPLDRPVLPIATKATKPAADQPDLLNPKGEREEANPQT